MLHLKEIIFFQKQNRKVEMDTVGSQELHLEGRQSCPRKLGVSLNHVANVGFIDLPDDVLYAILQKCDIRSLGRLCQVCSKLNTLILSDSVWRPYKNFNNLIGSSTLPQKSTCSSYNRQLTSPCIKEQLRLSHNWVENKGRERVICRLSPRQLPWIQFTGDSLWFSVSNTIRCYRLQNGGKLREDRKHNLTLQDQQHKRRQEESRQLCSTDENGKYPNLTNKDVSRFVVKDDIAVSGCRDGSLYVFDCSSGRCLDCMYKLHKTDTQTVDFYDTCIISGSRDRTVKILCMSQEDDGDNKVKANIDMRDRIWSIAMATDGQRFTVGTSGCKGNPSLSVWDVERAENIFSLGSYRFGAGVLDMKYEDKNTLLTCGYDATVKMWDMRSGSCVQEWHETFDTTLYCIQTDRNNTMVTGTARYGMIRLWDKRKTEPIQKYNLSQKSPVYSVAFDHSRMFAALDMSINTLDFSVLPA